MGHCPTCRFSFVVEPRTDYSNIYDEAYYAGRGADPHVSYARSVAAKGSVQEYEWRGIVKIVTSLVVLTPDSAWLDFGCGLGGLVRYGRSLGYQVSGFDEGYASTVLARDAVPAYTAEDLARVEGGFDVVTAIEVVEHVVDPIPVFDQMARLLRPGGLLFLTTGNAQPFRGRLTEWQYVRPDVHVSFYEPETLRRCLREVGLEPADAGYRVGFTDVIHSKVLRTLGVRDRNALERWAPWPVLSRLADRRFGVSRQPIGWRGQAV